MLALGLVDDLKQRIEGDKEIIFRYTELRHEMNQKIAVGAPVKHTFLKLCAAYQDIINMLSSLEQSEYQFIHHKSTNGYYQIEYLALSITYYTYPLK